MKRIALIAKYMQLRGYAPGASTVKIFRHGVKRTRLRLVMTHAYQDEKGKKIIHRHWYTVVVDDRLARMIEQDILKASELLIEGKLESGTYAVSIRLCSRMTSVEARNVFPVPFDDYQIPASGFNQNPGQGQFENDTRSQIPDTR